MNNIAGWENSTLQRIGKRIGKLGKLSAADVKAINNIAVVKQDMSEIIKELARVTGYNISQIEKMYSDLLEEQHLSNHPLYDYRGKKFVPFAENKELQAIARAYAKTTGETMLNLSKTKALCILDQHGNTKGLQRYYTDVIDKAVMQVTSGATDFHTAMRDSIIELGGSGIRVDYGGGVTRRLDTAVRQNLLWGAKQASIAYNDMIGEELDCDGIEIDWHRNPRPSHEFMQGKQYILGKPKTINGVYFESADRALEALEDYGCLHFKTPIICGISEPTYTPEELKRLDKENARVFDINGKKMTGYEASQAMRKLETEVRKQKSIRETARASGDIHQVRKSTARITACKAKYEQISDITGIAQEPKRMITPTMPKNTAKPLTNSGNGGIIESVHLPRIPQIASSSITRKIEAGEYSTKLSIQQYKKHIQGTAQYESYLKSRILKGGNPQSVLIISEDEAQEIIKTKSGTGIVKVTRKGEPKSQEDITCVKIIGKYYGNGKYHDTNKATIHYGKNGAHIVAIKGDYYD